MEETKRLENYTVRQLREIARNEGIPIPSKAVKRDIVFLLASKRKHQDIFPLSQLPLDSLMEVMLHSSLPELAKICSVSKKHAEICRNELFWKKKLQLDYPQVQVDKSNMKPKALYQYVNYLKHDKARTIIVPNEMLSEQDLANYIETLYTNIDDIIKFINLKIGPYVRSQKAKRGDVIILFNGDGIERNYGVYIYDGHKIVDLDLTKSTDGSIPPSFPVIDEFPITYWNDQIDDPMTRVWFDVRPYMDQIIDNMKETIYGDESAVITSFVHSSGVPFTIVAWRFSGSKDFTKGIVIDELQNNYKGMVMFSAGGSENGQIGDDIYDPNFTLYLPL